MNTLKAAEGKVPRVNKMIASGKPKFKAVIKNTLKREEQNTQQRYPKLSGKKKTTKKAAGQSHPQAPVANGRGFISVIETLKSAVFFWVMVTVSMTTFTNVRALTLQAWICMLISVLNYWECGQVVLRTKWQSSYDSSYMLYNIAIMDPCD